jgi:hypothetical protein
VVARGQALRRVRLELRRVAPPGINRQIVDTVYRMNIEHLSPDTPTVFETLDDAGFAPPARPTSCTAGATSTRSRATAR